MPGGRPTKLNQARCAIVLRHIRAASTRRDAAAAAGVHYDTLLEWIRRGEREEPEFSEFSVAFMRAEAEALCKAAAMVKRAFSVRKVVKVESTSSPDGSIVKTTTTEEFDWRAAAWFLERRCPQEWGNRMRIDINELSNDKLIELLTELEEQTDDDRAGDASEPAGGQRAAIGL